MLDSNKPNTEYKNFLVWFPNSWVSEKLAVGKAKKKVIWNWNIGHSNGPP